MGFRMNINQLEYLVTAMDYGSFADAAKVLYVTPQAVSKGISDLEKELQISLFQKSGRGVEPTSDGVLLSVKAQEIIQSCSDLKIAASSFSANKEHGVAISGKLNLAVASSPYEGGVIEQNFFTEFAEKYPQVKISLNYSSSGTCISALQEGIVDASIVVGRFESKGFNCTKLYQSTLRIAVASSHPLASKSQVTLTDIEKYPLAKPYDLRCIFPAIDQRLVERNCAAEFVEIPPMINQYENFLQNENGIVFLTYDSCLEKLLKNVSYISISPDDRIALSICFVYRKGASERISAALHRNLIQTVRLKKYILIDSCSDQANVKDLTGDCGQS